MKQTAEEAARGYSNDCRNRQRHCEPYCIVDFISGAEWQSKQSPWISVKERLPEEGQKVFVLVMYYGTPCIREEKFCRNSNLNRKGMLDSRKQYRDGMVSHPFFR
nr:MAG: Protein of unknown function (DUF551) [Bacteriophage sp.]